MSTLLKLKSLVKAIEANDWNQVLLIVATLLQTTVSKSPQLPRGQERAMMADAHDSATVSELKTAIQAHIDEVGGDAKRIDLGKILPIAARLARLAILFI